TTLVAPHAALMNFQSVRVSPNPWRQDRHRGRPVTFSPLSGESTVKIFTASGRLVKNLGRADGLASWDLTTDGGTQAASGLYVFLVDNAEGQRTRGKFAVVK